MKEPDSPAQPERRSFLTKAAAIGIGAATTLIPAGAGLYTLLDPLRHKAKTVLSFNLFIGASIELATRVACVSRVVADEAMRCFGVALHAHLVIGHCRHASFRSLALL